MKNAEFNNPLAIESVEEKGKYLILLNDFWRLVSSDLPQKISNEYRTITLTQ